MRQAAQTKMGFYPIPPEVVALIAARLRPPAEPWTMLDPCAGEGAAVEQLMLGTNCRPDDVYAVELDEARGRALTARIPTSRVLAPCSFFGTTASRGQLSLIYANPPFDDEIGGGGRVEEDFLRRSTELLRPGGVLVFVSPQHVAENWRFEELLGTWYGGVSRFLFPESCRRFGEVVTIGVRRKRAQADAQIEWTPEAVYPIPPSRPLSLWAKTMLTEAETLAALERSPLRKLLIAPPDDPLPEPPLALGQGHVALLLASGHLDGVVRPAGEIPHVVRGTARKLTYLADTSSTENDDGSTTEKIVMRERVNLTVRIVTPSGTLTTLAQEEPDKGDAAED